MTSASRGIALFLIAAALLGLPAAAQATGMHGDTTRPDRFKAAKSWGLQLQYPNVSTLARAPHDVLVTDYSRDSTQKKAFTPADVAQLKRKPDGTPRIVLAYLSIGEAENYRYYWHWTWGGSLLGDFFAMFRKPAWLAAENKEWRGNYAVRFWRDDWQAIFLGEGGYLDRIVAAGFDGVYLDKVDSSMEAVAETRATAKGEMKAFVKRIAEQARKKSPGFLVVPQNGEELLDDPAYVDLISGLGKEDLLYGAFTPQIANPADYLAGRVELLAPLRAAGKPVLAIEYIDKAPQIAAARVTLEKLGYVPTFADRDLGRLRNGDLPDEPGRGKNKRQMRWFF